MQRLDLHIDSIRVDTSAETEQQIKQVQANVRKGFELFVERIMKSPFARREDLSDMILERASLPGVSTEMLLNERGAEKFADELYALLTRGL